MEDGTIMELKDRIAIIKNRAEQDNTAKIEKEKRINLRREELLNKIFSLEERIHDLITLANECAKNGIKLPINTGKYGYGTGYRDHNFYADGINHHVGFMGHGKGLCDYIGIYNGGFCGVWDFYTNGEEVFLKHETNGVIRYDVEINHLEKFLSDFDIFESAFYKWIDSLGEQNEEKIMEELKQYREDSYYNIEDITEQLIKLSNLDMPEDLKEELKDALYYLKAVAKNKYNNDYFRVLYNVLLVITGNETF